MNWQQVQLTLKCFLVDTKDFRRMALITKGNVVRNVKEALEEEGYYMPADIQEIKLYGGETEFPVKINPKEGASL